jgi:hypothetical protein
MVKFRFYGILDTRRINIWQIFHQLSCVIDLDLILVIHGLTGDPWLDGRDVVGLYECAVDSLASKYSGNSVTIPKYLASTATTRNAEDQIQSVFNRRFREFPPPGLSAAYNFFTRSKEEHPLVNEGTGRLYVGVCCPGKGPQTPTVRIWSLLLQEVLKRIYGEIDDLDNFSTLIGYFNAVRELASAQSLCRDAIPSRMSEPSRKTNLRPICDHIPAELSSNKSSSEIPG